MKVVKLHEQTSEQFLNHTQNPKIAYQRPKKSKTTPKLSQNQKTQLKETKSIKACVGAFRTLLFNSYLSPLQCVSLLFQLIGEIYKQIHPIIMNNEGNQKACFRCITSCKFVWVDPITFPDHTLTQKQPIGAPKSQQERDEL